MHTAVQTRGRWHGERMLKVPRRHGASTLKVPSLWDFLRAIRCVRGTAAARDVCCRYGGCRIIFRPQSAAGDAEFETKLRRSTRQAGAVARTAGCD